MGTSSTLVTAVLGAFLNGLNFHWGEYDLARLAHEIERSDLDGRG